MLKISIRVKLILLTGWFIIIPRWMVGQTVSNHIHIDQFGYQPLSKKVAVLSDPRVGFNQNETYTPGTSFQVVDVDNQSVVFTGVPVAWNNGSTHSDSGDRGWWFDFTSVDIPGSYYIFDVQNNVRSYVFEIGQPVYEEVLKSAFKMFYYNRCNYDKQAPYAGVNWIDGQNFLNPLQDANCRYVYDPENASLERDLSGGWFDAGDYNKYVTFAAGTMHDLLSTYTENTSVFTDNMGIPESGNGISDLLDEINWELTWLEKMMNADGSVINKMGSISHSDNSGNPPSVNTDRRYYGPTCTSSAIALAGIFAHAAWVYKDIPALQNYGNTLQNKAITCFNYVLPRIMNNSLETNCDDGTIKAGDADWTANEQKENFLIPAVYLWLLTTDNTYGNYVKDHVQDAEMVSGNWLGPYKNDVSDALFTYARSSNADVLTANEIIQSVLPHVTQDWNRFFGQNDDDLYRGYMPDWSYHWGSNKIKSDYANLNYLLIKYAINPSQNPSYHAKSAEMIHYFHGVNPLNIVYLSNMYDVGAEYCANEIYHAWFADGSDYDHAQNSTLGPAPGYVAGGPNKDFSIPTITPPSGQPPMKSYLDWNTGFPEASWEITEPAIYYQASYLRMLARYVELSPPDTDFVYLDGSASGSNNGSSWENAFIDLESALMALGNMDSDTLKVAAGIYIPVGNDRSKSFLIDRDMIIIGGYPNGGGQRNPALYKTVISGDIGNDLNRSNDLYHVLKILNPAVTLGLIDICIERGNANGTGDDGSGSGIWSAGNLVLDNVQITNHGYHSSGNVLELIAGANLTISGTCKIENNEVYQE